MKFLDFRAEVAKVVAKACLSLGYGSVEVELSPPPNPSYGDLSCAAPIRVAQRTGEKPGDVAVKVAGEVSGLLPGCKYIGSISPHRGGFLNFTIAYPRFLLDSVNAVLDQHDFGERPQAGKSYAVEHTNVNPNKALHVGHARNLVLGDSLVRIMRYLGNQVQALNYIDDSGAQVADVIVGFRFLGIPDVPPEGAKFDVYCGDSVYTKVNKEYLSNPQLKEKQSLVLREIEKGSGDIAEYATGIVNRILADQLSTCWRLGASYDLLNWESQLLHSGMWAVMFGKMKSKGLVRLETQGENEGCWVIPDPETGEQKVLVRSDGTAVYVAKDIPYASWKIGLIGDPFGYDVYQGEQPDGRRLYSTTLEGGKSDVRFGGAQVAISVIDSKQRYLQRIVSKVLEGLEEGASSRYIHRGYEVVALSRATASQLGHDIEGEYAHMSGRKGLYVNVDSVLSRLKERAAEETRKRNPEQPQAFVDDVAEALAVAALRYELLKQDPDKLIVFDVEESLRFQGDTGPYLVYTYARARRILERAGERPALGEGGAVKLRAPQERNLVRKMSMMDMAADAAMEYLSPREMAKFAHDLAVAFNDFYEGVQVIREADAELRGARLALVDASSLILGRSLELIGVPLRSRI